MGQRYSRLSSDERILIEKLHCEQHPGVRKIAEEIGRDKSTVSRELRRGLWFASNENGSYRPYRPKRLKPGPWMFLVKSVFRVSSLIFFGFRHEACRPVVCFTGCPSCRT